MFKELLIVSLCVIFLIVLIAVCFSYFSKADPATLEGQSSCRPRLIATSKDGVNLYEISARCPKISSNYPVYFSARGAISFRAYSAGKTVYTSPNYTPNID